MTGVLGFIIGLPGKLKLWAVGFAAFVVAAFVAYRSIRKDGENAILAEQAKRREEQQRKYDQIDAGAPDLDSALGRMRQRSKGKSGSGPR